MFNNPIVALGGALVFPSIHSPNFLSGSVGWIISKDGSAEFNNIIARGQVQVIGSDGSYVYIQTSGGTAGIALEPPSQAGANYAPGSIATESNGLNKSADLIITSPRETGSGNDLAQILLEGSDGSRATSLISLGAHDVQVAGNLGVTGVRNVQYKQKASDQNLASQTTPQNDSDLSVALVANATYQITIYGICKSPANGLQTAWSLPTGTTGCKMCIGPTSVVADGSNRGDTKMRLQGSTTFNTIIPYAVDTSAATVLQETGLISTGANAGNFTWQWAQITSSATPATMFAGSYMIVERLG